MQKDKIPAQTQILNSNNSFLSTKTPKEEHLVVIATQQPLSFREFANFENSFSFTRVNVIFYKFHLLSELMKC